MDGRARAASAAAEANPHVTVLHRVVDILLFFLATPLAIWILVSVAIPLATALGPGPQRFIAYLEGVERCERAQAELASPALHLGSVWHGEQAWPYTSSQEVVRAHVSAADDAQEQPSADPATIGGNPVVVHLSETVHSWMRTAFWPIQEIWCVTVLTRTWYALQLLFIASGACVIGFFVGEYQSRMRAQAGLMPMSNRFAGWFHVIKYTAASIPGCIALPLPLPTLPLLIALYALLVVAVVRTRAHFTEF